MCINSLNLKEGNTFVKELYIILVIGAACDQMGSVSLFESPSISQCLFDSWHSFSQQTSIIKVPAIPVGHHVRESIIDWARQVTT